MYGVKNKNKIKAVEISGNLEVEFFFYFKKNSLLSLSNDKIGGSF